MSAESEADKTTHLDIGRNLETISQKDDVFVYIGDLNRIEGLQEADHLHLLAVKILSRNRKSAPYPDARGFHEESIVERLKEEIPTLRGISGKGTHQEGETVIYGQFDFSLPEGKSGKLIFLPTVEFAQEKKRKIEEIENLIRSGNKLASINPFVVINVADGNVVITEPHNLLREISREDYNVLFGAQK